MLRSSHIRQLWDSGLRHRTRIEREIVGHSSMCSFILRIAGCRSMLSPDCCLHGLCSVLLAWPLLIVACMLLVVLFFVVAPCVVGLVLVDCRWCYFACRALLVVGVAGSSGHSCATWMSGGTHGRLACDARTPLDVEGIGVRDQACAMRGR